MTLLLQIGLANVAVASLLALLAFGVGKVCRRPALVHSLWLLVMLKLVTPPLFWLPVAWPAQPEPPVTKAQTVCSPEVMVLSETAPAHTLVWHGTADLQNCPQVDRVLIQAEARLLTLPTFVNLPEVPPPAPEVSWLTSWTGWLTGLAIAIRPWLPILFWAWVVGAVVWFLWAGVNLIRFHQLLRFARPASVALQAEADRLAAQMGLSQCPSVWLLPGALPPMVWSGMGPARLFFPAALLDKLSPEERATLLAHELAHVCRRDHWVRGLEILVLGVYWWCPLVWWARRQMQAREEECCDAWVVGELPARSYASAILRTLDFLAEHRLPLPVGASGLSARVLQLKCRLTQIMQRKTPKRLSAWGQMIVAGLGLLLLPLLPTIVLSQPAAVLEAIATPVSQPADQLILQPVPANYFMPVQESESETPWWFGLEETPAPKIAPAQSATPARMRIAQIWPPEDKPTIAAAFRVVPAEPIGNRVVSYAPSQSFTFRLKPDDTAVPGKRIRWLAVPSAPGLAKTALVVSLKDRPPPPPAEVPDLPDTGTNPTP